MTVVNGDLQACWKQDGHASDYAELLEGDGKKQRQRGTVLSTGLLLASGTMGAGMLTLPFAVQQAGVKTGLLLLVLAALNSFATTLALGIGSVVLGARTYGEVVERAVGSPIRIRGVSIIDGIFVVYLCACASAFLLFIGDFSGPLLENVSKANWCNGSVALCVVAFAVVGPLTTMNEMNAVARVSNLSIVAMAFTCISVIWKSAPRIFDNQEQIGVALREPLQVSRGSLQTLGCLFYAFDMGSIVPPIVSELQDPTPLRLGKATAISTVIIGSAYALLAFIIQLAFVGHQFPDGFVGTRSDFTKNFDGNDTLMSLCRMLLIFCFTCSCCQLLMAAMKSAYLTIGQARGKEGWEPSLLARSLIIFGSLIPVVLLATAVPQVGTIVSALGSIGGCPEIFMGPVLLIAFRHVGASMSRLQRTILITCAMSLMILCWSYSLGFI
jgi:amino acid permease|eukprot:TRINITY_DN69270_c0_g1_i1.p1 TRINITY_DN69270_c0_g1~~TRINITY_DN69270_c0_g1_i1.p1  ORF type:complete len:460 (-),score=73.12 TRINITY_DN69270_c0_g1_i1:299-1621(-)